MTTTREELDFNNLAPRDVLFPIAGKRYVLVECDEGSRAQWQNAKYKASRLVDGKLASLDGLADTDALLVSLCLWERVGETGDNRRPVQLQVVKKWPARVVKALADRAKELAELEQDETAEQLREQIGKLQERLAKLDAREGAEKNGQSAGERISASAES